MANQPRSFQVAGDQSFETHYSWAQILALCDLFEGERDRCFWMLAARGKRGCKRRSVECKRVLSEARAEVDFCNFVGFGNVNIYFFSPTTLVGCSHCP